MNRKARTTISTILLAGGSLALLMLIYSLIEIYMYGREAPAIKIAIETCVFIGLIVPGLLLRDQK